MEPLMSRRLSDDRLAGAPAASSLIAAHVPRLRVSLPLETSSPTVLDAAAHLLALEMQNQELRDSLRRLERIRARYFELFESGPVAYFLFDERHHLYDLNLAAGLLLPGERSRLKHRPFFPHLPDGDRSRFHEHLTRVFRDRKLHEVELSLIGSGSRARPFRFVTQPAPADPTEPVLAICAVLEALRSPGPDCGVQTIGDSPWTAVLEPASPGRILLVDDEPGVRAVVARMLESLGLVVEEVSCGKEALESFSRGPLRFRAVVSDLNMPGMDGLRLSLELKRVNPNVGCVVMSGQCDPIFGDSALANAGVVFLQKPFTLAHLEEAFLLVHPSQ